MKFFFDRNSCVRTARMLAIYEGSKGHHVRHHNDDPRFSEKSTDEEIIKSLHDEDPGWVFVGGDGKILRNKVELSVLAECNLTYLVFHHNWCNTVIENTCWMLIKGWPKITSEIERLKVRSIVELKYGSSGSVEIKGATASFRMRIR
jgi:hypothetical protein